jgi:dTDP-4-amino-4,6-dideoxygalactose transaminase
MADYLLSEGIDTAKYLDTIAEEARATYGYHDDCPNAELLSKMTLLIPIHYTLNTRDIAHIASSINNFSQGN